MDAIQAGCFPPFEAPDGWRWVFCTRRWHVGAKRYLIAAEYGRTAWCILVRRKK
ncbi:MAG: hypothetical protein JWQ87_3945 [Candidatus Sulfotelmatobacter sp.]|nr:hypothetical protein [Candidatus Sulfotelmatobacter sp.]